MPPEVQPLLLRPLDEQTIRPADWNEPHPATRVVSVTDRVLLDEVAAGRFRRNLLGPEIQGALMAHSWPS